MQAKQGASGLGSPKAVSHWPWSSNMPLVMWSIVFANIDFRESLEIVLILC